MKSRLKRLRDFLIHIDEHDTRPVVQWTGRILRHAMVLFEQFLQDGCLQKAAALTYTTILSLFPMLAVLSIFAANFHPGGVEASEEMVISLVEKYLLPSEVLYSTPLNEDSEIESGQTEAPAGDAQASEDESGLEPAPDNPEASAAPSANQQANVQWSIEDKISDAFASFRQNSGQIVGLGSLGLMLAAIALFYSCERFFNEIWRVQARRPFLRTFSAFASVLVLLSSLIGAATYFSIQFNQWIVWVESVPGVGVLARALVNLGGMLAPLFFIWLALATAFFLIPNTRVRFSSALVGALVSALLWVLLKRFFFTLIGISELRASVFNAFGATLLFLFWLYALWVVVLLGIESSFLTQHFGFVLREHFDVLRNETEDPRIYVLVLGRIAQAFQRDEGGVLFEDLRRQTHLRDSHLEEILDSLKDKGYIIIRDDDRITIGRPLENIRLKQVFELGFDSQELIDSKPDDDPLARALADMDETLPHRFGEKTLADLLRSASRGAEEA